MSTTTFATSPVVESPRTLPPPSRTLVDSIRSTNSPVKDLSLTKTPVSSSPESMDSVSRTSTTGLVLPSGNIESASRASVLSALAPVDGTVTGPASLAQPRIDAVPPRAPVGGVTERIVIGGKVLVVQTGSAPRAHGDAVLTMGHTVVTAEVVAAEEPKHSEIAPLRVDYDECSRAGGRIPGARNRKDGAPTQREILIGRMIDRPLRPLFPKQWQCETQLSVTVHNVGVPPKKSTPDTRDLPDVLGMNAAAIALCASDIPWNGPVAAVRIGRVNGELVAFPNFSQVERSDIDLVVAFNEKGVLALDGDCDKVSASDLVAALTFGFEQATPILELQQRLAASAGKAKRDIPVSAVDPVLLERMRHDLNTSVDAALKTVGTDQRKKQLHAAQQQYIRNLGREGMARRDELHDAFDMLVRERLVAITFTTGQRIDGRKLDELRTITCAAPNFADTHGSSAFQRGETISWGTVTIGGPEMAEPIETIFGDVKRQFIGHYDSPAYATGETGNHGARREEGHGNLMRRALLPVIPSVSAYPHTIVVDSLIRSSNGSSSMASVCSGSMALMDAGVPISEPVAGCTVGLFYDGSTYLLPLDICGEEDHWGGMDFKIAGTRNAITAVQLDTKTDGIPLELFEKALAIAQKGRGKILDTMTAAIAAPRAQSASETVQKACITVEVDPRSCGLLIGPKGSTIKALQAETNTRMNLNTERTVLTISGEDDEAVQLAKSKVQQLFDTRRPVSNRPAVVSASGTVQPCVVEDDRAQAVQRGRVEMTVDASLVGAVKGRGAENIKAIEQRTHTSIHMDKSGATFIEADSQDACDAARIELEATVRKAMAANVSRGGRGQQRPVRG